MKIYSVNNIPLYKSFFKNNRKNSLVQKADAFQKTTFKGQLPRDIEEKIPSGYTIYDLIKMSQEQSFFLMGMGANSEVYKLPYLDDYVLKVLNKDDPNGVKIGEFPDYVNLGQPVWQDDKNPRLIILKRVHGQPHSIVDWSDVIWDKELQAPKNVTRNAATSYLNKVVNLAILPQEAFDDVANQVKLLSNKGYKVDSINPNNLIVGYDEIHIIDYFKVKPEEKDVYQNCSYDLIAIMLDFTLLQEYIENLRRDERDELKTYAKMIYEKVQTGAKNVGLSTDVEIYKTYINETSKWFIPQSTYNLYGRENIRRYDYRAQKFLEWLERL